MQTGIALTWGFYRGWRASGDFGCALAFESIQESLQ